MVEVGAMLNTLVFFAVVTSIVCVIFALILSVSIIYNKIYNKITVKQWFEERKYFLLFYLYSFLIIAVMMFFMFFGFPGMLAGILFLVSAAGFIININEKRGAVIYFTEPTAYVCHCGENIEALVEMTASGNQKVLYYICQRCNKKYNKNEIERDGDTKNS